MPTPTLQGDNKQDEQRDPGQAHYDRQFNDIVGGGAYPDVEKGVKDLEGLAQGGGASADDASVGEQERNPATHVNNFDGQRTKGKGMSAFLIGLKRRGPAAGIGGGVIGLVLALTGFAGFGNLMPDLTQKATIKNNASSTFMERRIVAKANEKMADTSDPCDTTRASCRNKKMPKAMLTLMAAKGMVAVNADGSDYDIDSKDEYVDRNPYGYKVESLKDADGNPRVIPAADFSKEYKSNPVLRKVFKSTVNAKYWSVAGVFMAKNFFNKIGLKRDGGMAADPEVNESNATEKLNEKLKPAGGDSTSAEGIKQTFRERAKALLTRSADKVKKTGGDPLLMVGTAACTAINMPRFVAGTFRAIQVVQLAVLVQDLILSPGGGQMASGLDAAGVAAVAGILATSVKGKAPVDSAIFQKAIGVNKNKVNISKYAPGQSMLSSPIVQGSMLASASTKETCDLIASPQAAFVVTGVEAAIAAGSAGVGAIVIGVLKAVGKLAIIIGTVDLAVQAIIDSGILDAVADAGFDMVKTLVGDYLEGAEGVELGDALGVGILAYFSLVGLSSGAAVLKKSQVLGFNKLSAEVENEYREEDIATLSPFDTSSQYTFLGSIVSNMSLSGAAGLNVNSAINSVGYIAQSPLRLFSQTASAAEAEEVAAVDADCGYAESFGISPEIAINASGYPCVGVPVEYADVAPSEVLEMVEEDIDPVSGEPTPDGDIALMMNDCSAGDLETVTGCVISGSSEEGSSEVEVCVDDECNTVAGSIPSVEEQERAAQSIYLYDQRVEQIFAGKGGEEYGTAVPTTAAGATIDMSQIFIDSTSVACAPGTTEVRNDMGYNQGTAIPIKLCALPNTYETDPKKGGRPGMVNSRASGAAFAMFESLRTSLGRDRIALNDSFRTYAEQQEAKRIYGSQAADAGSSNHQLGIAFDINMGSSNGGGSTSYVANVNTSYPQNPVWEWLAANAGNYGFKQLPREGWHWSATGG